MFWLVSLGQLSVEMRRCLQAGQKLTVFLVALPALARILLSQNLNFIMLQKIVSVFKYFLIHQQFILYCTLILEEANYQNAADTGAVLATKGLHMV